jgi:hypothetical protein
LGVTVVFCCWSAKGGSGVTVVAAALAGVLAQNVGRCLLVDADGDAGALAGLAGRGADSSPEPGFPPGEGGPRARVEPLGGGVVLASVGGWAELGADPFVGLRALGPAASPIVVDLGTLDLSSGRQAADWSADLHARWQLAAGATVSLLVTRPCYLALRRAAVAPLQPSGVVLVDEPGRALGAADVAAALGAPVVAEVPFDAAIGRAVDAGVFFGRMPSRLARALAPVAELAR